MTAPEEVVAFLLDMVERLSGNSKEEVTLPMSRYEIADYLAISVETVSRSLTELRHRGAYFGTTGGWSRCDGKTVWAAGKPSAEFGTYSCSSVPWPQPTGCAPAASLWSGKGVCVDRCRSCPREFECEQLVGRHDAA